MTAWDDLLDEFRALGGTAENIRLGQGEFGRGIFPVDPARPIAIHLPDNLLVASKDMDFVDGIPRVGPDAAVNDRERAWLNRYQEDLGWGGGGAEGVMRMFEMSGALPAEFRQRLLTKYACGPWFAEPSEKLIRQRFFETRIIRQGGRLVVMPLIELVNHGDGTKYDLSNGIAVRGSFPGEVFVKYSDFDSLDYFGAWGFVTQRPVAFSIPVHGMLGQTRLEIRQGFNARFVSESTWIPAIERNAGVVSLPFLMIGNMQHPHLPKGMFFRLMRDAGYTGFEEAFDIVHHLNRTTFLDLLRELEDFEVPIARLLRRLACNQLRAMSCYYGVREY